ncbi:hypothetical protein [Gynurincola endophyticus]|uniref:hypothetical protein n=1 Tax=Gynurincola endophyticus TaxID=2479004 RepID=UPI000F8CDFC7|nr:hypothetical protein [Gynurincola endophyticus]
MKKFLCVLTVSFIAFTSFVPEKKLSEPAETAASCPVTIYDVIRYYCGDVYVGAVNTTGDCNHPVILNIVIDRSEQPCTHDHSAPPDGLN